MRFIISPAKKMRVDTDSFACTHPLWQDRAARLHGALCKMDAEALRNLWNCSDKLVRENMDLLHRHTPGRMLTPALLAYDGIQYKYMAPNVFTDAQLDYVCTHLRILSGMYGMLRPMDGVIPYRLEMQARLDGDGCGDLYGFWHDLPARQLAAETGCVINLASKEYSRCVEPHLPVSVRFITCVFAERQQGKLVEKGTLCKMARGRMIRFAAETGAITPDDLHSFRELGYRFSDTDSTETMFVYIKED